IRLELEERDDEVLRKVAERLTDGLAHILPGGIELSAVVRARRDVSPDPRNKGDKGVEGTRGQDCPFGDTKSGRTVQRKEEEHVLPSPHAIRLRLWHPSLHPS